MRRSVYLRNRSKVMIETTTPDDQPELSWLSGIRALAGLGKEIWAGVDADEYVRDLREGWE
jgi:hypothetical protein